MSKPLLPPLRQISRSPAVSLAPEEVAALAFISERHKSAIPRLTIAEFTDEAGVGWTDVEVISSRFGATRIQYRVSPTGRVYQRHDDERGREVRGQSYDQRPQAIA